MWGSRRSGTEPAPSPICRPRPRAGFRPRLWKRLHRRRPRQPIRVPRRCGQPTPGPSLCKSGPAGNAHLGRTRSRWAENGRPARRIDPTPGAIRCSPPASSSTSGRGGRRGRESTRHGDQARRLPPRPPPGPRRPARPRSGRNSGPSRLRLRRQRSLRRRHRPARLPAHRRCRCLERWRNRANRRLCPPQKAPDGSRAAAVASPSRVPRRPPRRLPPSRRCHPR